MSRFGYDSCGVENRCHLPAVNYHRPSSEITQEVRLAEVIACILELYRVVFSYLSIRRVVSTTIVVAVTLVIISVPFYFEVCPTPGILVSAGRGAISLEYEYRGPSNWKVEHVNAGIRNAWWRSPLRIWPDCVIASSPWRIGLPVWCGIPSYLVYILLVIYARRRRGACTSCAYEIGPSRVRCPECGSLYHVLPSVKVPLLRHRS